MDVVQAGDTLLVNGGVPREQSHPVRRKTRELSAIEIMILVYTEVEAVTVLLLGWLVRCVSLDHSLTVKDQKEILIRFYSRYSRLT